MIQRILIRTLTALLLSALALSAASLAAQPDRLWWQRLNDRTLDSLVDEALVHNLDLRMAGDRILQSKAAYRASYGAFTPNVVVQTGWLRERESQHLMSEATEAVYQSYYSGLLKGSLSVDIFGQLRKATEARRASYKAAQADREVVMLTLSKEVASAYVSLCSTKKLIAVLTDNIATQAEIAAITQARYEAGLASQLDVAQALATLHNTQAGITGYQSDEVAYLSQLAVLLGTEPRLLQEVLRVSDTLPDIEYLIPQSISMEELRARPDLRQEEWVIDGQSAALGVAHKAWLPTFLVTGYVGLMSHDLNRLLRHRSYAWQVEPVMQWTLFNGGQRIEAIREAKAKLQEQVDNYNLLLLTAMQQVESATMAYEQSLVQVKALAQAVNYARQSLQLSLELYKMGLTAFINVVQAQQSVLQYQTSWVTASNAALQNVITLFVAISPGITE